MNTTSRILLTAALILPFTSCSDKEHQTKIEQSLESGEAYAKDLFTQTLSGDPSSITVDFSADFPKDAYLREIAYLEKQLGQFTELDTVRARWKPAEEDHVGEGEENPIKGDTVRVNGTLMSGADTGAVLSVYLSPSGSSWTVVGMTAETSMGDPEPQQGVISQAEYSDSDS